MSQTTSPADLPAILRSLSTPEFAPHEAAQKRLAKIPLDQVNLLRDATQE